ncbi:MAG: UPF0182 family protein [Fimbriimonadales bacterium]
MPQISDKERRRAIRWGVIVLLILLLVMLIMGTLSPYVDYLWYVHDARQPQVFTLALATKGLLFLPAFFVTWALLHFSLKRAFKLSLIYIDSPSTTGQVMISNALHFVQERGWSLVRILAPIFAFFSATGFSGEWNTFLLARHAEMFGKNDPLYGLDLSFFVFTLPWYRAVTSYVFGVLLLTTILTVAIYAGIQLLAAMARVELGRPTIRLHISLLAGVTLLVLAGQIYLKTYEFGLASGTQFTGAGYSASIRLVTERGAAILVALLALGTLILSRSSQVYGFVLKGGIGVVVLSVLGVGIVPAIVQSAYVEPNKLTVEPPFAARAIGMTRYAYGLDKIVARDFPVQNTPTPQDVAQSQATLDNMRLWDPEIVRQSSEFQESLRKFYRFNDVDVDRYQIGGKTTEVMIAPRDINLEGLTTRGWVYDRLQYTHGYGLIMTAVNSELPDGEPQYIIKDIPPVSPPELPVKEPGIYYSDFRDESGSPIDEYALVDSKQVEYDYPAQDKEVTTRWRGTGGIPVGGFFRRLALSISLGDGNLLISGNITDDTRLLMRRSILDRCQRIYRFLKFDNDPCVVLVDGKIYWLLDAYTTTDQIPYSDVSGSGEFQLNYIRNSVKIVIDAYTGDTTAYAIDPSEPILRAYRSIYPGLVHDLTEMPAGFKSHFRYPEDMFRLQSGELSLYHVTDSVAFLNGNDAWEMPRERGLSGERTPLAPYYVEMKLPGEQRDGFILMLPFTPRGKPNMSGWLAAHCDPDRYGEMVLYNFAKGANVDGAEQTETKFASNPDVNAARLQLQGGGGTEIIIGNMLVIPIGNSVMYAESLFPKSSASGLQAAPQLRKVVLGVNGKIVIGDTYQEALDKLFGPATAPPTQPAATTAAPSGATAQLALKQDAVAGVREALGLFDQADAALKAGDWAKYGELQKKARERLRALTGR